jgi:hypothetical protein
MFAYCKTLTNKTVAVHYDMATTIREIREQIQQELQVPSLERVRLVIYGNIYNDAVVYATLHPEKMGVGGHIVILPETS